MDRGAASEYSNSSHASPAAVLVIAFLATSLLMLFGSARIADATRNFTSMQHERANHAALLIEDLLSSLKQIARVQTVVAGPSRSRGAVVRIERTILGTADPTFIYGTGVAYQSHAFDPRREAFGVYGMLSGKGARTLQIVDSGVRERYEDALWFKAARNAGGRTVYIAPYRGRNGPYIAATEGFYAQNGSFAGAAIADVKLAKLQSVIGAALAPGDRMTLRASNGTIILRTGEHARRAGTLAVSTVLRSAPWTLTIASPAGTRMLQWQTAFIEILGALLIWLAAVVVIGRQLRTSFFRYRSAIMVKEREELRRIAYCDPLTGLPNRQAIYEYVTRLIRNGNARRFALLFIDLDCFSVINDSLGHTIGDSVLVMVAKRIAEGFSQNTHFGRIGGDEFVLCIELEDGERSAITAAKRIVENVRRPLRIPNHDIAISCSVGVVLSAPGYGSAEAMLRDADIAMSESKKAGRSRFTLFDRTMHERAVARLEVEQQLRGAIHGQRVRAHYQPLVALSTGAIVGVEALARLEGAEPVPSTAAFISIAEQTGLISAIDSEILEQTCEDARRLHSIAPDLAISVNVSAKMLTSENLLKKISSTLRRSSIEPRRLKIELTETAFVEQPANALLLLNQAKALGIQVVIDDFGMGYSSLNYVRNLPISGLKIDRAFVEHVATDPRSFAIVQTIVSLAHALGAWVTAEGIETREQYEAIKGLGVEYGQGWYFCRALPYEELVTFLRNSYAP